MLTKKDIKALNKARRVLKDLDSELMRAAYVAERDSSSPGPSSFGRAAEATSNAADAIFNVLNVVNAYGVRKVSDAEMHMREEVESNV